MTIIVFNYAKLVKTSDFSSIFTIKKCYMYKYND